jgi:hypothetical protein
MSYIAKAHLRGPQNPLRNGSAKTGSAGDAGDNRGGTGMIRGVRDGGLTQPPPEKRPVPIWSGLLSNQIIEPDYRNRLSKQIIETGY